MTNLIPAITSVGSIVTSILSAGAAFLAWRTKLNFSKEFKEAKEEQVKATEAQKKAEIEKIKIEIEKKEVQITNLRLQLEVSEKNTPQGILEAHEALKKLYGTLEPELKAFVEKTNNSEFKNKIKLFQAGFEKFEKEIKATLEDKQKHRIARKNAQEAIKKYRNDWITKAFKAVAYIYPDLKRKTFYFDMNDYLELVFHSLIVDNYNLLDKSNFNLKLPTDSYRIAFKEIKNDIIQNLSKEESQELTPYFDYIINNVLSWTRNIK